MASSSSYALLYLGEASVDRTAFDQRGHRAGGAFGTAIAAHAIILLSIWGIARVDHAVAPSPEAQASAIGPFIFTRPRRRRQRTFRRRQPVGGSSRPASARGAPTPGRCP